MQTLKLKITIETSEEETVKVKQSVVISRPASQDEIDAEITKVEAQYTGQTVIINWNEEQLEIV